MSDAHDYGDGRRHWWQHPKHRRSCELAKTKKLADMVARGKRIEQRQEFWASFAIYLPAFLALGAAALLCCTAVVVLFKGGRF